MEEICNELSIISQFLFDLANGQHDKDLDLNETLSCYSGKLDAYVFILKTCYSKGDK